MRILKSNLERGTEVVVLDEPTHGNACHEYEVRIKDPTPGPAELGKGSLYSFAMIGFQKGPIFEVGINGVTHEDLLEILIDRLESFQSGKYSCKENDMALGYLRSALGALNLRTESRRLAGIEGTHKVGK